MIPAVLALVLASAGASFAIFPAAPDGTITLKMNQGLFLGKPAWYICTDANDIRTAASNCLRSGQLLNMAPKLGCLNGGILDFKGAAEMFVVTNPVCTQGPVFSTAPCLPYYSGKWRVILVTFKHRCDARNITNALPASKLNPFGLPDTREACYDKTDIVVDYPIVALGQLGAPGQVTFTLTNPLSYRIGEAKSINYGAKMITLPTYYAYGQNPLTKKIVIAEFIVTETTDWRDACYFGWSYAPGLTEVRQTGTSRLWVFGFSRTPQKPWQFPVLENIPTPLGPKNRNYDYSPIMDGFMVFDANPGLTVNNPTYLECLLDRNVLHDDFVERLNGSVVGYIEYECPPIDEENEGEES